MKKIGIVLLAITVWACNSTKMKTQTSTENTVSEVTTENPEQLYFRAIGTEPFWGVEMSNKTIKYTTPDDPKGITFPAVKPVLVMDANSKTYMSKSNAGEIKMTITYGKCSDGMSDMEHNYSVAVALKKKGETAFKDLRGCGNYIIDYRLHDIWVLEEMEGQKITDTDFNKRPMMEINAREASFNGIAGCNRMFGKLFSEKELLRFTNVGLTRMACDKMANEAKFVKALESSTAYEIKNNRLYLSNPDGMKLIFKKTD